MNRRRHLFLAILTGVIVGTFLSVHGHAHGIKQKGKLDPVKLQPAPSWFINLLIKNAKARARIRVSEKDGYRYVEADGLPDHPTGQFPNRNNPNTISAQNYSLQIPLNPEKNSWVTIIDRQVYGIALNGVQFDPNTAEFWNNDRSSGWNIDAKSGAMNLGLDDSNAHVQPDGSYHYHGVPNGLMEKYPYKRKPILLGGVLNHLSQITVAASCSMDR